MTKKLEGQVIVITGASAGIGAATALAAAKAGMRVVLSARREDKLREVAERVQAARAGAESLIVACDIAQDGDVQRLIEQTMAKFGRVDVMFANAGYGFMAPLETLSEADHRAIFETNYWGTVRCVNAVMPVMKQQHSGHIIITSSIVGRVGLPYYAHYSATKAAQDVLATALRLEVEPFGIDVSAVYPIGTKTEFFEVSAKIGGRDSISENTPQVFMQTAEHVAGRVMKCIKRPCPEVWPARWAHCASSLACMFPRLTRRALRKHAEKDRRFMGK